MTHGHEGARAAVDGPLLVLTHLELTVMEQAHLAGMDDPVAGLPPAAPASATTQDSALGEAHRSLLGRGLIGDDGRLARDSAPADLAALMLDVRLGAETLVVIERRIGGREDRPDLRLLHLIPEGGVVEDVHPEGLVGLDLHIDPGDLVQAALAPVLPADASPGRGSTRHLDPRHPERFALALDQPGVLAELTLADGQGRTRAAYLLAAGGSGCFLSERPPEQRVDRPTVEDGGLLAFAPVCPQDVQDLLTGWVEAVVEPVDGPVVEPVDRPDLGGA